MVRVLRTVAQWAEWIAAAFLAIFAVLRTLHLETLSHPITRATVQEIHDHQVPIVFVLAFGVLAAKATQAAMERWTTNHRAIKAVLDAAHKTVFADVKPEQHYEHRVTLFRGRRHLRDLPVNLWEWRSEEGRKWPWSLRMYCRSGTSYQHPSARLLIDDEDEKQNEGVAGKAWFNNAYFTVTGLPEWSETCSGNPSHEPVCRDYAKLGLMTPERVHSVRVKSRSLSAHVVRTRSGVRWGVLVFDSRQPERLDTAEKKPIMELSAYLLSQIV